MSGMAAIGLYWLAFGGLEGAKPKSVENDLHDLEYAIIGSLSHSLLTADKRLNVIYRAIKSGYLGRKAWFTRENGGRMVTLYATVWEKQVSVDNRASAEVG